MAGEMFDFEKIFAENPCGVFATQDGDGVKTRVFQYLFTDRMRVYFCTGAAKDVYKQMTTNPNVSFCTWAPNFAPVVSVDGKATFVEDMALKKRILDENPAIKGIYRSEDNPEFKVFYVAVEEVRTFSFAEGPKAYKP